MTRMWMVNPRLLCDEHLQREHHEIHQFVNVIRGDWNITDEAAIAKAIGHGVRGQVFPDWIEDRHDELAEELQRRGIGHDGKRLDPPEVVDELPTVSINERVIDENRRDLAGRCSKCRDRINPQQQSVVRQTT